MPRGRSPQTSSQAVAKCRGADVAHALMRAAATLVSLPRDRENVECRQECRHGTQECVRHQQSRPRSPAPQMVCGARDVPRRDRPLLVSLPRDRENVECRQECRHGTQECVRHQQSRPRSPAPQMVCGARDVPRRDRPPLLALPLDRKNVECRQECVRHQNPRPSDWAGQMVCGVGAR